MATHRTMIGALDALSGKIDAVPGNIAKDVKQKSEANTPVRTGHLKASYEIEGESKIGQSVTVGNTADYAAYVEFGTPMMAPRAMMQGAVAQVPKKADKYLGD